MASNTVDNLLYFVASNFDTLDRQRLNTLLVDFYQLDELTASKSTLIKECEKISISDAISESKKKRLFTKSEVDTKQKISKDILDIWSVADVQKGGQFNTNFVPTDPPRIPASASFPSSSSSRLENDSNGIVAKALDGQRYPLPLCECMWV